MQVLNLYFGTVNFVSAKEILMLLKKNIIRLTNQTKLNYLAYS